MATAISVTITIFILLQDEQHDNFDTAFEQFSRTVGQAAVDQLQDAMAAYDGLSTAVSIMAKSNGAEWPYFSVPYFEQIAGKYRQEARLEIMSIFNIVKDEDRDNWLAWAKEHYEQMVEESHMIRYGNLDKLVPEDYHDYIYGVTPHGLVPDSGKETYFTSWSFTPPQFSYALLNWNIRSIPDYEAAAKASLFLRNETILTRVRPYGAAVGAAMTQEQHEAMHSKLLDSNSEHPHSMFFRLVLDDPNDINSEAVAALGGAMAWDGTCRSTKSAD